MEAFHLPTTTEGLTSAYILKFLIHHDFNDLAATAQEAARKALAPNAPGLITLTAANKTFDIKLNDGSRTNHSTWTYEKGQPVWHDLNQAPGTLYTAPQASLPVGNNTIWIQQYPPSKGNTVGRTVIEFYTDSVITAVFKTDVDNSGAAGAGVWSVPN